LFIFSLFTTSSTGNNRTRKAKTMSGGGEMMDLCLVFMSKMIAGYLSVCLLIGAVWVMYKLVQLPVIVCRMCWQRRQRIDAVVFGEKRKTE
jgi:hypothetical protein